MREIVEPTLAGMRARGTPFVGILYAGLMITADGPKLIEYNVRFGDPECQVLMPRMKSDLVAALLAACDGVLEKLRRALVGRGGADRGHGGAGLSRRCRDAAPRSAASPRPRRCEDVLVFHAGTRQDGSRLVADGGRVLSVTATGKTIAEAQARAYEAVDRIDWPEGFCRRDIGWRAVQRRPA